MTNCSHPSLGERTFWRFKAFSCSSIYYTFCHGRQRKVYSFKAHILQFYTSSSTRCLICLCCWPLFSLLMSSHAYHTFTAGKTRANMMPNSLTQSIHVWNDNKHCREELVKQETDRGDQAPDTPVLLGTRERSNSVFSDWHGSVRDVTCRIQRSLSHSGPWKVVKGRSHTKRLGGKTESTVRYDKVSPPQ